MAGFIPWNNNIAKYEDTPKGRQDLQDAIDQYFLNPPHKKKTIMGESEVEVPVYSLCGLALALGFSSRSSINDYIKRDNNCSNIVRKAVLYIEGDYECKSQERSAPHFLLKNMGWKDKTEVDVKSKIRSSNINVEDMSDEERALFIKEQLQDGKE